MSGPDPDRSSDPLIDALQVAFAALIETGEIDITTPPDAGEDETEVQADDWTLHLEGWPIATAWIAIDQEPDSAEHRAALDATFDHRELAALRDADRRLEGALVARLRASGDDLSVLLAVWLEGTGQRDDDLTNESGLREKYPSPVIPRERSDEGSQQLCRAAASPAEAQCAEAGHKIGAERPPSPTGTTSGNLGKAHCGEVVIQIAGH